MGRGEDFNSRLRLSGGGLEVWRLREHMRDQSGLPLLPAMDLLVLDATPVRPLVDYLTRDHDRLPDVEATVRLPEEVRVVQLATATNGHAVMREEENVNAVLSQIATERSLHPVSPEGEGAVCFKALKKTLVESGFPEGQVATYGRMRGTNALAGVARLHLIGRPMPPGDDLVFLARVLHPDEAAVSEAMVLSPRRFGGQPFEVDVVDFADGRVAELLRSEREDEMEQALHRARIFALDPPQLRLLDGGEPKKRSELRLVLHTSHPIPGLRVDELLLASEVGSVNESRQADAERRIRAAKHRIEELCEPVTITAVAKLAKADKRTVARVLRTAVDTPKEDLLYRGLHRLPQATDKPPAPRPTPAAVSVRPFTGRRSEPLSRRLRQADAAGSRCALSAQQGRRRNGPEDESEGGRDDDHRRHFSPVGRTSPRALEPAVDHRGAPPESLRFDSRRSRLPLAPPGSHPSRLQGGTGAEGTRGWRLVRRQ